MIVRGVWVDPFAGESARAAAAPAPGGDCGPAPARPARSIHPGRRRAREGRELAANWPPPKCRSGGQGHSKGTASRPSGGAASAVRQAPAAKRQAPLSAPSTASSVDGYGPGHGPMTAATQRLPPLGDGRALSAGPSPRGFGDRALFEAYCFIKNFIG